VGESNVPVDELRERLRASRRALLDAVRELTEQDFAADFERATVASHLMALALAEREAVRDARAASGGPPRPQPPQGQRQRVVPPQVIHDLAGARYETMLLLDELEDSTLTIDAGGVTVRGLL
jgi:hypothetical protein